MATDIFSSFVKNVKDNNVLFFYIISEENVHIKCK